MPFDWVTWSVWFVGLVILVVWIIVPMKEFAEIIRSQHASYKERVTGEKDKGGDHPAGKSTP